MYLNQIKKNISSILEVSLVLTFSLTSKGIHCSDLYQHRLILPVCFFPFSGIIHYFYFVSSLFFAPHWIVRFSSIVVCITSLFTFTAWEYSIVCIYHNLLSILLIYSLVISTFWLLLIIEHGIPTYMSACFQFLGGLYLRVELLDYEVLLFIFWRKHLLL